MLSPFAFAVMVALQTVADGCSPAMAKKQPATPKAAAHRPGLPTIAVTEHLGVERRAWPIRAGVPFPRGALKSADQLTVSDGKVALPTQTRELSRWPDGSMRWVLVDFQADLKARQHRSFEVRPDSAPPAPAAVVVDQSAEAVSIDTGAMRFEIPTTSAGWLRAISVRGQPLPIQPLRATIESDGHLAAAEAPQAVAIEERGPLRAQVRLQGRYESGFEYDVRLQAFAGHAFVRVLHTFINARDADYTMADRIALDLPAQLGKARLQATVAEGAPLAAAIPASGLDLAQPDNLAYTLAGKKHTGRLNGWFEIHGDKGAVGLDAPFFWQEYPQGLRVSPNGIAYDLWSSAGGPAKVGVGAAKTHEFVLVFAAPGHGSTLTSRPARGVTAAVDPSWIAESGALPNAVHPAQGSAVIADATAAFERYVKSVRSERWDDSGQVQCPPPGHERPRTGLYGMFNWGDWNFRGYHDTTKGCDAWGNHEYDLTQALALLYAAGGRDDVFWYLTAAARHFTDVDRIHHQAKTPKWVGMNHPKNPLHFTFELGGVDLGHTWVEGLFSFYSLTGDERARAGGVGIADYLVARLNSPLKGNPRQFGWPAIALVAAYDGTGDARYQQAAIEYARRGMQAHPAQEALKNWKMSILADAIASVHQMTGDEAMREWLLHFADLVVQRHAKDARYYAAIAYVARLTGGTAYRDAAHEALARIAYGDWGKPFTIATRNAFRISALLAQP